MWPQRIAIAIALVWTTACLTLAAVIFFELRRIESPERYLALVLGLAMLYLGGSMLAALIRERKPKESKAPVEVPPREQVRGRTSYRDAGTVVRNGMFAAGAIFLAASITAAPTQPVLYVLVAIAAGILAGACVMTWRQLQFGRARLELEAPARRGDTMRAVITTSGSAWATAPPDFDATVELLAIQTFRRGRARSTQVTVARESVNAGAARRGKEITVRFTVDVPVVDTREGRFSWNVQLVTHWPKYRTTFLVDVA